MRQIGCLVLAVLAGGLTACGVGYQGLDPAEPGATVQLNKSYAGTGDTSAVNQYYAFGHDPRCAKTEVAAAFTWTTGDQSPVRVPADRPLIIWAATVYAQSTDVAVPHGHPIGNFGRNGCSNNLTFTPRAGHTYASASPAAGAARNAP
ncbi:hypothetical protein [Brevundimonas sp. A19_0]|uniref:hypothetical protein n=1 Tax=Brevundimonas sp. A19_0 TaxID=2821087 RepID=UPI001ADB35F1|nr:hypothetical protein [Brevundimonas sp. A19_0]MBO9501554.1 hypothetical protein [Brevundimonas sp. A19_0]